MPSKHMAMMALLALGLLAVDYAAAQGAEHQHLLLHGSPLDSLMLSSIKLCCGHYTPWHVQAAAKFAINVPGGSSAVPVTHPLSV